MAVATNAPSPFARRMLTSFGVIEKFEMVIGADIAKPKPDPDMLFQILNKLEFEKSNDFAWMVGDNQKDIDVAKNAGIGAIYATWGFQSEVEWEIKAHKPSEILDIILYNA